MSTAFTSNRTATGAEGLAAMRSLDTKCLDEEPPNEQGSSAVGGISVLNMESIACPGSMSTQSSRFTSLKKPLRVFSLNAHL